MTHKEIINVFENMRLIYAGTSEPRGSINRAFRGYWKIPGENYEFRLVAIQPRNTWAIEVIRFANQLIEDQTPKYLLSGTDGIFFIQRIICDQIDLRHLLRKNQWELNQTLLGRYMHKRMEYLILHQLKRD